MKRALAAAACALLLCVAAAPAAAPGAAAPAAVSPGTLQRIDAHVEDGLEANRVPGAVLAVVDADGPVHERAFGETGRGEEAGTLQTPFIVCSVTKSFTALATMQLAERGALDLDSPVDEILPWFEVSPGEDSESVTVRTLLHQTSGLPTGAGGAELRYLDDKSIEETARTLAGEPLSSPPGEEFEYSNGNYVLLGAVIEAASGRSYQDYLRDEVIEPLGMDRTYLSLEEAERAGLAEGHRYWFGWTAPHTSYATGLIPTGGVISTAPDMGRYLRMMLNGGELDGRRIVSAAGVATLTRANAPATVGAWAKDPDVAYGMGWYVGGEPFGPRPAVFHPGGSPDFGSMAVLLPEAGQGLVLLYNATPEVTLPGADGDVDRIAAGAVSLLMGSEPAAGWSMGRYYVLFDLVALVLLALASWRLARAIRALRSRRGRTGTANGWAGPIAALAVGVLLLALPALGLGWSVLFLSVPDFALVLVLLGTLLAAQGAIGIVTLVRARRSRPAPSGPAGSAHRLPPAQSGQ